MGVNKDFDAARKARTGDPYTFKLAGEEFSIERNGSVLPLLDLANSLGSLADLGGNDEDGAPDSIKAVAEAMSTFTSFITSLVTPDQQERFTAALRRFGPNLAELTDIAGDLIKEVVGRPLEELSASPEPSSETGGPSKVVDFSAGTVTEVPEPAPVPDVSGRDITPSFA